VSFLGGLFAVAPSIMGGLVSGQNQGALLRRQMEEEDRARKAEEAKAAIQAALIQSQTEYYNRGREQWVPATEEEAVRYYGATHPEEPPTPRNIDPLSGEGIAAALRRKRGEAAIDAAAPKRPTQADEAREARGLAILSQMGRGGGGTDEQKHAFARAYAAIIARHPDWSPGRISDAAAGGTASVDPTMKPSRPTGFAALLDQFQSDTTSSDGTPASLPPAPPEPPAPPAPIADASATEPPPAMGQKRIITQDQADFLKAKGAWDPLKYEIQ
jgi:hypothetical protein